MNSQINGLAGVHAGLFDLTCQTRTPKYISSSSIITMVTVIGI